MVQVDANIYEKRHNFIGLASFIISLVALILILISMGLMFAIPFGAIFLTIIIYPAQILVSIGLVLGAVSYFGPFKVKFGLGGFILAIITTSITPLITIIMSFAMYSYTSGMLGGVSGF